MTHDSLEQEFSALRPELQGAWDEAKSERELSRLKGRIAHEHTRRPVMLGLAAAAMFLLAFGAVLMTHEHSPDSSTVLPAPLVLADGSTASPMVKKTELRVLKNDAGHVVLGLEQGQASFRVTPNANRLFSVRAAGTLVEVLGTTFEVTLGRDEQVHVHVTEGVVRVSHGDQVTLLRANDSVTMGGKDVVKEPVQVVAKEQEAEALSFELDEVVPPEQTSEPPQKKKLVRKPKESEDWRLLAKARDFQSAVVLLLTSKTEPSSVEDLMLAADAMRSVGRFDQAMRYHEKVIASYPKDQRASLAAHHMGRTLLNKMNRPASAAKAFAKVQALHPPATLAEDALAGEVEAWERAGEKERARQRALVYVERYPDGIHVRKIRRFGGLD